jgi:hypothetical protein
LISPYKEESANQGKIVVTPISPTKEAEPKVTLNEGHEITISVNK